MPQPYFPARVPPPPPTGNAAVDRWLIQLAESHNAQPRSSWFSGMTPNSLVTGYVGDLAINLASGSTMSRVWIMGGSPSAATTQGWRFLSLGGS